MEEQKLIRKKNKAKYDENKSAFALICKELALFYQKKERFKDALDEYQTSVKIYKDQNDVLEYALCNRGIGDTYIQLEEFDKALKYQKIYLDCAKKLDNKVETQRALAVIGHTYMKKYSNTSINMDLKFAQRYFKLCLEESESLSTNVVPKFEKADMSARALYNLALVEECHENVDEAIKLFQRVIQICRENDIFELLLESYMLIVPLLSTKKEYNSAIQNCNFAIDTGKKLKNMTEKICEAYFLKADILLNLRDIAASRTVLHKAYKVNKKNTELQKKLKTVVFLSRTEKELLGSTRNEELKVLYEKMGDGLSQLKCYDKAIEFYKKMLEYTDGEGDDLSAAYYSLAETYKDNAQYDFAIIYYEKEYELCKSKLKNGLNTLCEIADTKEKAGEEWTEVSTIYKRALEDCQLAGSKIEERRIMSRFLDYLSRNDRLLEVEKLEDQLKELGGEITDSESEVVSQHSVGEDIDLDRLTEVSDDSDFDTPKPKRKTFKPKVNLKGETPLHVACIKGEIKEVRFLLEQNYPINVRDHAGWLPIHEACNHGDYEIVKLLIAKRAAINDRGGSGCHGVTPLHDAALNGHLKIIELLLDKGASPVVKTDDGETPYHMLKKVDKDNFTADDRILYDHLLRRMGAILDKAGIDREINHNISNAAFVGEATITIGKRGRSTVTSCRNNLDDDSDNSSVEDNVPVVKGKSIARPSSHATKEYQQAMDCLRHNPNTTQVTTSQRMESTVPKKTAFLENDEMDVDDWLEDDLATMKNSKRRKLGSSDLVSTSSSRCNKISFSNKPKDKRQRQNSMESSSSKSSKSSTKSKVDNIVQARYSDEGVRSVIGDNSISEASLFYASALNEQSWFGDESIENLNPNKRQSSLLDLGVIKFTTESNTTTNNKRHKSNSIQPRITSYGTSESPIKSPEKRWRNSSSPVMDLTGSSRVIFPGNSDPILAMDVNIEGRSFRITTKMSLMDTLNVKWLALEAARRYAKKEYIEPVLELVTKSGAELVDDDPISSLFITDNQVVEVNAKVLKWNLPPIYVRYKEACADMNTKSLDKIIEKLEEMSVSLDLGNNGFQSHFMAPVCKALSRETKLLELDLSTNFLSLDCVKLLCNSLPTLENLNKLNLCCTNLQREHLRCFTNMFVASPVKILEKLQSLDVSENFIGDDCLQDLATITRNLNLKELNLSLLDFTDQIFKHSYNRGVKLKLELVDIFKISGTKLSNSDIETFVSWLKATNLRSLDVSNNKCTSGLLRNILNLLCCEGQKLNLEYLNLARCGIEDDELPALIRSVENLEQLDLSYTKITDISLRLLENSKIKKISLKDNHI